VNKAARYSVAEYAQSRCAARVRRFTGSRFPKYSRCEKPHRPGFATCWSHRKQEKKLRPEKCQFCGLDPVKKGNEGRQVYVCDKCEAFVCSNCSESAPGGGVLCKPCDHREKWDAAEQREGEPEREPDRCSRCDAVISRERANRFSLCETCDPDSELAAP
jgi:hypothetical protein